MTSEQRAQKNINAPPEAATSTVTDIANENIHASTGVAVHEFALKRANAFADYLCIFAQEGPHECGHRRADGKIARVRKGA